MQEVAEVDALQFQALLVRELHELLDPLVEAAHLGDEALQRLEDDADRLTLVTPGSVQSQLRLH